MGHTGKKIPSDILNAPIMIIMFLPSSKNVNFYNLLGLCHPLHICIFLRNISLGFNEISAQNSILISDLSITLLILDIVNMHPWDFACLEMNIAFWNAELLTGKGKQLIIGYIGITIVATILGRASWVDLNIKLDL